MITTLPRPVTAIASIDVATRREFLAALAAAGLLVGCAANDPDVPAGSAPGYPRTVRHRGGELVLDAPPTRIVAMTHRLILDELLALDAVPVGYTSELPLDQLPVWTREEITRRAAPITHIPDISGGAGNLEAIAALTPDLIVLGEAPENSPVDLLSGIAPVLLAVDDQGEFDTLDVLAQALAREQLAADLAARTDAALASVTPAPGRLGVFGGYADGGIAAQVFGGGSPEWTTLTRAGFTLADFGRPADEFSFDLAEENFALLDNADLLWNFSFPEGDDPTAQFRASPILQNLDVVRTGALRQLTLDQSLAISFPSSLAVPFLVDTLNELSATP